MRTITFDVEPRPLRHNLKQSGSNGLFVTLFEGYSNHIPITISPDDVLNTVATLWAKYVGVHAERFRSQFVDHEGKKTLTYISGGTWAEERHEEFFNGLIDLVINDQGQDMLSWGQACFSTTVLEDRLIRGAAMLASQKEYYEYCCQLMCGFSEINLLGTKEDWEEVINAVAKMPILNDAGLQTWRAALVIGVLPYFAEAEPNEEFWQSAITNEAYGSGPRDFDGWALMFNPFNEKGEWMDRIELYDVLNLTVDFEIEVNDNGHEFTLGFNSGVDGVVAEKNGIRPNKRMDYKVV